MLSQVFDRLMGDLHHHLVGAGFDDLRATHCLNVLRLLDCEGTRPTTLAGRAGMTPQAMGELITYLERRGYVRKVPDPADGRGRVVVYADRGVEAAAVATEFFGEQDRLCSQVVGADRFHDVKLALAELLPAGMRQGAQR